MATAASVSARLLLDSTDYERGLTQAGVMTKKFESNLSSIGSKMTSIGTMMSAAFTVPIVAGATMATKAFIDLDTQMRNIQSITLQDDASLAILQDRFVKMSVDMDITRDSAAGLAEAYYFISSAGFAGEAGMEVLTVATKAASAGLTDTMVAGNAIIAVLNAYGLEAEDAAWVSDVLFKTVDKGVLTFEDLASQLGDIVSTTATLDVGVDEVGSALAIMTRKGISASEAVTALNQLMLQIISPSSKMKETAEGLGVEWDKLNSIIREEGLEAMLDYITDFGGDDALLSIFGDNVRALKAALALGKGGTEAFEEMNKEFMDVSGRTQEAFEQQNKSVAAQLANFKNQVTSLGITLAAIFLPYLLKGVEYLKPLVEWLQNASPTTQKLVIIILALVAVIGPLLLVLGTMATMMAAVITIVTAIGLPILILLVVIGLLIAGLVFLYVAWRNNWFGIRDITDQAILRIRVGIFALMVWAENIFSGKLGGWTILFANTWNAIRTIFQLTTSMIRFLMQAWFAAMRGDWYAFGTWMRQAVNMYAVALYTFVNTAFQNLAVLARLLVAKIVSSFTNINWHSVGSAVGYGIYAGMIQTANMIISLAQRVATAVAQAFSGFWGISSPSTLMQYYAQMLGEGFEKGLDQTSLAPTGTMSVLPTPSANLATGNTLANGNGNTAMIELLRQIANKTGQQDPVIFARAVAQEMSKFVK